MKKLILSILFCLISLTVFAQLKTEFVIFRNTATNQLYIKRVKVASQPTPTGTSLLPFIGIDTVTNHNNFTLNWGVGNIDHYVLQTSTDSTTWTDLANFDQSMTDTTITYPDHDKHWYRVYVRQSDGSNSDYSNAVSAYQPGGVITLTMPPDQQLTHDSTFSKLIASASYSDGTITNYAWSKVLGLPVTINTPDKDTTTIYGYQTDTDTMNVYKFKLVVTSSDDTKDSGYVTVKIDSFKLPPYRYLIQKGASFNFTPIAQDIPGYTDVIGDPSKSIVTATDDSTEWSVSTINTSDSLWNPSSALGNVCSTINGMEVTTPVDPWGYEEIDSSALTTGFINAVSENVPGVYNLKISGLDQTKLYQIKITGSYTNTDSTSGDYYGSRTVFAFGNGENHAMTTDYNTSKYVVGDTIAPDSNGDIFLSVTGYDKDYVNGSTGVLSAMKVYELSKDTGTGTTDLYKYYYDTVYVNDGNVNRMCLVYKPYNFNPDSSYPLLLYLDGGESTVKNTSSFDPEISIMDGIGTSLQHYEGKMYGINASGDTSSFVILIPQYTVTEAPPDTGEVATVIRNFKIRESGTYKFNDTLFVGGFSSGAVSALYYTLYNASKVTAAYIASPVADLAQNPPYSLLRDSIPKFADYGTKMWIVRRVDAAASYTDSIKKYLDLYAPDNYYYTWWDREHSGFAWEWTMDTTNSIWYHQNPYDWFFNPSRYNSKVTAFAFNITGSGLPSYYTSMASNPNFGVRTATDANTGVTLSTVATTKWVGYFSAAIPNLDAYSTLAQYPQYVFHLMYTKGYMNQATGGYETNGANLKLTGLLPNHSYTISWGGAGDATTNDIGIMTWGTQTTTNNGSNPPYYHTLPYNMTGMSDGTGEIDLGFYPDPSGSGTAYLQYLFVREN